MDEKPISKELIERYLDGTATQEERALVESWHLQDLSQRSLEIPDAEEISQVHARGREAVRQHAATSVRRHWPRIAAAASVLVFLSIGGYFLLHKKQPPQQIAQNQFHDIKPGGNKAILTLSDGQMISLTDAKKGKVAAQGNAIVNKTAAGVIEYATTKENSENAVQPIYNTLTTPRGGRFEGLLPDGTHVILDAASSIKYQVNTTGKDRMVWITGQVHFNVTYDENRPFYVNVKGQIMKDLGTAFNINAYDDEPIVAVTLEEGSLSVSKGAQSVVLVPGEQAVTKSTDNVIKVQQVNLDNVIAWTKGQTSFQNEDIQKIMREVSRWYDVNVQYEGQIPNRQFDGSISRNANLSDLLKVLEFDNIHFKVNGKTITVEP